LRARFYAEKEPIVVRFDLKITNYDNAAMADDPRGETARILRDAAARIEASEVLGDGSVRDSNGNRVAGTTTSRVIPDFGSHVKMRLESAVAK
jgi:hypothetical protein